jgi:hypothetical protein
MTVGFRPERALREVQRRRLLPGEAAAVRAGRLLPVIPRYLAPVADQTHRFMPGDRVRIQGVYDGDDSDWLRGGPGYDGTIRKLTAKAAAVELDNELELRAADGISWQDFGAGSLAAVREVSVARGRRLTLMHGWVGQTWADPVRLQVGLCEEEPDLYAHPRGRRDRLLGRIARRHQPVLTAHDPDGCCLKPPREPGSRRCFRLKT